MFLAGVCRARIGEARRRVAESCASSRRRVIPQSATCSAANGGDAIRTEIARVVPFYDGIQHLQHASATSFRCAAAAPLPAGLAALPGSRRRHSCAAASPVALCQTTDRPPGHVRGNQHPPRQAVQRARLRRDRPAHRAPPDAILVHPDDAAALHLASGGHSRRLDSPHGRFVGRASSSRRSSRAATSRLHWPGGRTRLMQRGVVGPTRRRARLTTPWCASNRIHG